MVEDTIAMRNRTILMMSRNIPMKNQYAIDAIKSIAEDQPNTEISEAIMEDRNSLQASKAVPEDRTSMEASTAVTEVHHSMEASKAAMPPDIAM